MGSLVPGAALIYESVGGLVYARYRDPPHNKKPRWVVGGCPSLDPTYDEWTDLKKLAQENETIRKQLDKLMVLYYTVKDNSKET